MLGLDVSIIALIGVAALIWLFASRSMPSARIAVFDANNDDIARSGAKIAGLSVIRSIAGVTALTGAVAIALFGLAKIGLALSSNSPDNLASIVGFRDKLDGMLEAVSVISTTAWIAVLVFLSLLWLIAARSRSERRWKEAVGARKKALMASLANETIDTLTESLGGHSSEEVTVLESRIRELVKDNILVIKQCRATPVVELGNEGHALSLSEVAELQAELRDSHNGERQPDDSADANEESQRAVEFANQLDEVISNVEKQFEVELQKLDGSNRTATLKEAERYIEPDDSEVQQALREALVGKQLQNHDADASSKSRADPELIREWMGSAVTSKASVEGSAKVGKTGARLALVAIILSLIGFNAGVVGADISQSSQVIELTLLADQNSARVEEAVAAAAVQNEVEEETELASDEETFEYLKQMLRVQVARSVIASTADAAARTRLRRSAFQLAAVEVQQQILGASTRDAAQRLDTGARSQSFHSTVAGQQPTEIFDDALDPRIRQLRESPTLWTKLRREAARPAARNDINNALFKAAFTADHTLHPHITSVYAEAKAGQFAEQVAKNGGSSNANLSRWEGANGELPLSTREKRIFADFEADLPGQLETRMNAYNTGRVDPGSLNRVVMRSNGTGGSAVKATQRPTGHVSNAFRSAGQYNELFPAAARAANAGSIAVNAADVGASAVR